MFFCLRSEAEPVGLRLLYNRLQKRLHQSNLPPTLSNLTPPQQALALAERKAFLKECETTLLRPHLSALQLLELLDELDTEAALAEKIAVHDHAPHPLLHHAEWGKLKSDQAKCKQMLIRKAREL